MCVDSNSSHSEVFVCPQRHLINQQDFNDSRAHNDHYRVKQWLAGSITQLRQHNVTYLPLISQKKIILTYFSSNNKVLFLFKQSVKALSEESSAFELLWKSFPSISYAKIRAYLLGRKLIFNHAFDQTLNSNANA